MPLYNLDISIESMCPRSGARTVIVLPRNRYMFSCHGYGMPPVPVLAVRLAVQQQRLQQNHSTSRILVGSVQTAKRPQTLQVHVRMHQLCT